MFRNLLFWSVFLCLLFHVSGAVGMVFFSRETFVSMTPLNLSIMFVLLLINGSSFSKPLMLGFIISFFTGLFAEMIGVHTGLLFGNYSYGDAMSVKLMNVPILIGINWFVVVFCSYVIVTRYLPVSIGPVATSALAALMTTGFDWLMEPVAVTLGFWSWQDAHIPIFNFICWFVISFLLIRVFIRIKVPTANPFALYLLLIQAAFFLFLRFFL